MAWAWPRRGAPYGVSGGPCGACAVFSQCLCSPWHHYKSHAGPVPALCKSQGPLMIFGWPLWGLCGFSICALYAPLGIITGPTYGLPVAPENLIGHCNFSDGSCGARLFEWELWNCGMGMREERERETSGAEGAQRKGYARGRGLCPPRVSAGAGTIYSGVSPPLNGLQCSRPKAIYSSFGVA